MDQRIHVFFFLIVQHGAETQTKSPKQKMGKQSAISHHIFPSCNERLLLVSTMLLNQTSRVFLKLAD